MTSLNKITATFLLSVILLVVAISGASATVTTTLNSPTNGGIIYTNPATFNCSASTTVGNLVNLSLMTNTTGTWTITNTTSLGNNYTQSSGKTFEASGSTTAKNGMGINVTNNGGLYIMNMTVDGMDITRGYIIFTNGTIIETSSTKVGNTIVFTGNTFLEQNKNYSIEFDKAGSSYTTKWNLEGAGSPIQGTYFKWLYETRNGAFNGVNFQGIVSIGIRTPQSSSFSDTWNLNVNQPTKWNCLACDGSGCSSSNTNYTTSLDSQAPTISVSSPTSLVNYGKVGNNLTLNFTATDSNLGSCWFYYNNTDNATIVPCSSGTATLYNFTLINPTDPNCLPEAPFCPTGKKIVIYSNDSAGNTNYSEISWDYKVFENSRSYSANAVSGGLENFVINITYDSSYSGVSVLMNYNGANYTMSTTDSGTTREYSKQLTIPSVNSQVNNSIYFIITLSNSTTTHIINTDSFNQTVSPFLLDSCGTYTNTILNFSMYDEDTLIPINGTIKVNANIYSYGTSNLVNNYNATFNYLTTTQSRICLQNITQNYTMSYSIQFYGDESQYFKKYKMIQSITINNNSIPQHIKLYNLNQSRGFPFKVIVVGNLLSATGNRNLLVDTQRQYLNLDEFISIESAVTDNAGETITHLIQNNEVYNFVVSSNGETLGTFNNYRVQCANPALSQCSITLNLASSTTDIEDFENYGDIEQTFLLDEENHILYQTFSSTDGQTHSVRSYIMKADGYGNTTICNNTASGTSGTLNCNIPLAYQNTTFFVQTFVDGEYIGVKYFSQGATPDWRGADIFIELLMFSALVLLFIGHPVLIVLGAIIGLVSSVTLIYVSSGSWSSIAMALLFYVASGVIIWIVLSRRNS